MTAAQAKGTKATHLTYLSTIRTREMKVLCGRFAVCLNRPTFQKLDKLQQGTATPLIAPPASGTPRHARFAEVSDSDGSLPHSAASVVTVSEETAEMAAAPAPRACRASPAIRAECAKTKRRLERATGLMANLKAQLLGMVWPPLPSCAGAISSTLFSPLNWTLTAIVCIILTLRNRKKGGRLRCRTPPTMRLPFTSSSRCASDSRVAAY